MKYAKPLTDEELANLFTSSDEEIANYNRQKEAEWQQFVEKVNADLESTED